MEDTEQGKTSNILIRDLRKSDLNGLQTLFPACFTKELEIQGFDRDRLTRMVNRVFGTTGTIFLGLMRLLGKEPVKLLVAEADGKVVGTTIVNNRRQSGYISTVMVHPDYRRRGIATRLMTYALGYIRKRKKVRAVLDVDSVNTGAKNMYIKLGFKPFDQEMYLVRDTNPPHKPEEDSKVKIREFQKSDLDEVYRLIQASEDSNSLRILDFNKKDLEIPFFQRMFRFGTRKKLVAVIGDKIVGYVEVGYTTPKEAGRINSVEADSEAKSFYIEKLLIVAANDEIVKAGIPRIRLTAMTAKKETIETAKNLGFLEALVMDVMVKELQ